MTPAAQTALKATYEKAMSLTREGSLDDAMALLDGLALQAPQIPEIQAQRAKVAALCGHQDKRKSAIEAALKLRPNDPALLQEAIAAHSVQSNHSRVLELYDALIALDPKAIKSQADKALYLQRAGDFDASERLFRKLLKKHPTEAELYRMFAATTRFKPNDPLIGAMRRLAKHPRLSQQGKMQVNFALAKAMEDTKKTDQVFPHLKRANAAQASLWPDDPHARQLEWQSVVDAQRDLKTTDSATETTPGLIFVTGLPRSGTTLAEQIIASHSLVQAGGEIATALRTAYSLFGAGQEMMALKDVGIDKFAAFAQQLERQNRQHLTGSEAWLTDKSIMAFLIYGLLHTALPNARFVVVHRDPRDIAVSIFKNHFSGGTHRYATDLATIAHTTKLFRQIIRHWRNTLPDRFTEIHYEDLVRDPVGGSKALIAAAGLDWEDQCLDFHQKGGSVKTLSLHQVRQPIYQSSAAAWRRYESDLHPFFEAWGDTPWD